MKARRSLARRQEGSRPYGVAIGPGGGCESELDRRRAPFDRAGLVRVSRVVRTISLARAKLSSSVGTGPTVPERVARGVSPHRA